MAQLNDTNINGNLRVTGQMYGGHIQAESVADYTDGTSPIKIGWSGSSLSSTERLAAYSMGNKVCIRDIHVDDVSVGYAGKYGTVSSHPQVGASNRPLYVNSNGNFTPLTASAGANNRLIYMSGGELLTSSQNVGDSTHPVYMNAGTFTQCTSSASTAIGYTMEYSNLQTPVYTLTSTFTTVFAVEHVTGFDRLAYFTVSNTRNAGNSTLRVELLNATSGTIPVIGDRTYYYCNMPSYGSTAFSLLITESMHSTGSGGWGALYIQLATTSGSPQMDVLMSGTTILLKNS
jgi:hypothetical protein